MSEAGDAGGHADFGIEGYVAPKTARGDPPSYTMPKVDLKAVSSFPQAGKGLQVPGPGTYDKDSLKKNFASGCRCGTMSKVERGWLGSGTKGPAVGTYETQSAQLTPRVLGGPMSKRDRGCWLTDKVAFQSKTKVAPGKYSPEYEKVDPRSRTASFGVPRKETGRARPGAQIGPGTYHPKKEMCEETKPSYTVPKDPAKSFLEKLQKQTDKTPGPGTHLGQTAGPKSEDRAGIRLHSARLLADHIVSPRRVVVV